MAQILRHHNQGITVIKFIKTLSYDLKPADTDVFAYLTQVGLQKVDPPSLELGSLEIVADCVLHSSLRRVVDCIKHNPNSTYIRQPALREVPFDLVSLCTRDEWNRQGSMIVRQRFKEAFIKDQLPLARAELLNEIEAVLLECSTLVGRGRSIAVVSHSFRLKLIEAYIKSSGMLRNNPSLLHDFLLDADKTYPFGGGFEIAESNVAELFS